MNAPPVSTLHLAYPFHVEERALLNEALSKNDDWTIIEDRRERKKAQNRLNQRAARRRKNPQHATHLRSRLEDVRLGHQVGEIRDTQSVKCVRPQPLPPPPLLTAPTPTPEASRRTPRRFAGWNNPSAPPAMNYISSLNLEVTHAPINPSPFLHVFEYTRSLNHEDSTLHADTYAHSIPSQYTFPLTTDHLLPLIHANVYRAILTNLLLLRGSPNFLCTTSTPSDRSVLTLPLPADVPPSLYPTALQMRVSHPRWIDIFPQARMRDAFISRWVVGQRGEGGGLDECALCLDVLGLENPWGKTSDGEDLGWGEDYRQGLIIWGNPWEQASWEVTDGFLRRWGWVIKECRDEVLGATNRWRAIRGEEPLGWVEDGKL